MRGPPNQPGKCVPEEPGNQRRTPQRAQGSRTGSCTRDRANAAAQNQRHPKPQEELRGPARRHDPRKRAQNQSRPTSVNTSVRKQTKRRWERARCPSTWNAWQPCADVGDACGEHADQLQRRQPAGRRRPRCQRDRVRQGARPIRHRSWTKRHKGPQGQERWEQRVQKRQRGAETLSRQHGEHEQRVDALSDAERNKEAATS